MNDGAPSRPIAVLCGREARNPASIACRQFEAAMVGAGLEGVFNESPTNDFAAKALNRLGLLRKLPGGGRQTYLAAMMQASPTRLFPEGLAHEIVPFCWDFWEPNFPAWLSLFRRLDVRLAFVTARQSAHYVASQIGVEAVWMPEAIDTSSFDPAIPLASRTIDVLELGRRSAQLHEQIRGPLETAGKRHVYDAQRGVMTFPTRADLVAGLSDTKISVCLPSSVTDPQRSGRIETLTQRYLESMAAGALVYGTCPQELRDLFGYDPVLATLSGDPASHLLDILGRIEDFEELRLRNLERVRDIGDWKFRAKQIVSALSDRGYAVP